jgi:hypothetical protein
MSRSYGEKFLRQLADNQNDDQNLGIDLAKLCVKANLPMVYVGKALDVTKLTIFHWFRGREISPLNRPKVHAFMALVGRDIEAGVLPSPDMKSAKAYISDMVGYDI